MALDMDKRSKVVNLCNWSVSFTLPNSNSDILLGARQSTTLNNAELVSLADNQNIMFYGSESGDHARVWVENPEYREYVGFDDPEKKKRQFVLNDEECQKIFDLKQDAAFQKHIKEKVVMSHEKDIIMAYARKIKCDSYNKIKFLEEYTGLTF